MSFVDSGSGGAAFTGGAGAGLSGLITTLQVANQNTSRLIQAILALGAFEPSINGAALIACTTTSASVQLSASGNQVRVANFGSDTAHVVIGASGVSATTSDLAILPLTAEVLTIPNSINVSTPRPWLAARANSSTTNLSIAVGTGS